MTSDLSFFHCSMWRLRNLSRPRPEQRGEGEGEEGEEEEGEGEEEEEREREGEYRKVLGTFTILCHIALVWQHGADKIYSYDIMWCSEMRSNVQVGTHP